MRRSFLQDSTGWLLSVVLVLILILSSTIYAFADEDASSDQQSDQQYEAGEIIVSKTAVPASSEQDNREYVITLTAAGSSVLNQEAVDIVLVIDTSDSMNTPIGETTETRLDAVKAAARTFADSVFADNSDNRIAIVDYAGDRKGRTLEDDKLVSFDTPFNDAITVLDFSNDIAALDSCLDELSAAGGTNIEAGFYQARQELIDLDSDAKKAVVLISDGQPTHSYSTAFIKTADSYIEDYILYPAEYEETYGITTGDGENYDPIHRQKASSEAMLVRDEFDAKIFTVGISDPDNYNEEMQEVLDPTGEDRYHERYYETSDTEGLSSAFASIYGYMNAVAENAVIVDVIGEDFELVDGSAAGAEIDGQRLIWQVGMIDGDTDEVSSVSFKVRAKDQVSGELFTNEAAYLYFDTTAANEFYDGDQYNNPDVEMGRKKRLTYDRPVVTVPLLEIEDESLDEEADNSEPLVQPTPVPTVAPSIEVIDDEIVKTGEAPSGWLIGITILLAVVIYVKARSLKRQV